MSSARGGFTAIELLVVIGIMMVLLAAAVPSVLPAMRRGAVNSAASDITNCWRQARALAMSTPIPPGATPAHFGIAITQAAGQRVTVGLIYDNIAAGTPRFLMRDQDPLDPATYSAGGTPVMRLQFSRTVTLATTPAGGGAATTADRTVIIYAQYGTGLPIDPARVAANHGMIASPTSIGVSSAVVGYPSVCQVVRLQTFDYDPTPATRRGFASGFAIYHAGFSSVQEL